MQYLVWVYLDTDKRFNYFQNWVFHGICWDLTRDFMIELNVNNGRRKDRLRWSNYIVPLSGEDMKSTVPLFLYSISQSLFICGKTLELLHLINPEVSSNSIDCFLLIIQF